MVTNRGLTGTLGPPQSPQVTGGGAVGGLRRASSRSSCSAAGAASGSARLRRRSFTSLRPSADWMPACDHAAGFPMRPIRELKGFSAATSVFGLGLSSATFTPNSAASLSSSGRSAGAAEVTIISASRALAKAKTLRREGASEGMVARYATRRRRSSASLCFAPATSSAERL